MVLRAASPNVPGSGNRKALTLNHLAESRIEEGRWIDSPVTLARSLA